MLVDVPGTVRCRGHDSVFLLTVRFRPVMTASCPVDSDEVPVADFPIQKPEAYVPRWLHIDYRHGKWVGEFGYVNS